MALETADLVPELIDTNPTSSDAKSQGDDHLRMIKDCLLNSFAGWTGLILATGTEAAGGTANDYVVTVTPAPAAYTTAVLIFKSTHANTGAATLQVGALAAKTLKNADGGALIANDIKNGSICVVYYDGTDFFLVSSNVNNKVDIGGDTYTGTHNFTGATITVPTPASGSAAVTRDYMDAVVIAAGNLPDPTAHSGELLSSDGVSGAWITKINTTVMKLSNGADPTKLVAFDLSGMTTGTTKTLLFNDYAFNFTDPSAPTKKAHLVLSAITAGQDRSWTAVDKDIILDTPAMKWIQTVSASASATIDLTGFSATYDSYVIKISGVRLSNTNADLLMQFKTAGTLQTSGYYGHQENTGDAATTYSGQILSGSSLIVADDFGTDATLNNTNLTVYIDDIASTARQKQAYWTGVMSVTSSSSKRCSGVGMNSNLGALSEVRFLPSAGTITIGDFKLYGIRAV